MTDVGDDALGLLKVKEAAVLLRLGERTVWRMVASGELNSIKHGRSRLIPRVVVADWLRRQMEAAHSDASSPERGAA